MKNADVWADGCTIPGLCSFFYIYIYIYIECIKAEMDMQTNELAILVMFGHFTQLTIFWNVDITEYKLFSLFRNVFYTV
jgi:hypothetical protein